MITKLSTCARRGLRGLVGLVTDPLGRRRMSRQLDERTVWLGRVVTEQTERLRGGAEAADLWKVQELETLLRFLRKKEYLAVIRSGELAVPELHTDHPLAADSNDTLHPRGAKNDNSICLRFNQRLYQLFGHRPGLKVLDLGCAGGGLVRTLIDDGHFAVGLEGSDWPRLNQFGEWGTIPHHLLTCDITKPFTLSTRGASEPIRFDAVTAWEVMEHIPEDRIAGMMANVARHLAPGGWVLLSISTAPDFCPATGVNWHRTVRPRKWWEGTFATLGFVASDDHPFGTQDWLRGSGNCRHDTSPEDGTGFHLAMRAADYGATA